MTPAYERQIKANSGRNPLKVLKSCFVNVDHTLFNVLNIALEIHFKRCERGLPEYLTWQVSSCQMLFYNVC